VSKSYSTHFEHAQAECETFYGGEDCYEERIDPTDCTVSLECQDPDSSTGGCNPPRACCESFASSYGDFT
jgi:hypothetical protein